MRWTRAVLREALHRHGVHPKKSLGQNFLVDENFLRALARDTGATGEDLVIEIGSGPGNLTDHLAERAGHVWAFEVDPELHAISRELLADRRNVTLSLGDGARFDSTVDPGKWRGLRVVSNLPYFDWQRLLLALLATRWEIRTYTLMVQSDVHRRLRAGPGTKDYGPWPALVGGACEVRLVRRAGRELFWP
ncbi:MAG TPA: rRNA adenine N-6-methyltransferase family protein, partial [Planctomycetota bacterium]|nr:rRNA adenine N-6-methyltransferase family protein [Planctomycetota bacterium]